jgi:hypothetical protein
VPTKTTIQSDESTQKIVFNYNINDKKFVAVVAQNKSNPSENTILEVSPVSGNFSEVRTITVLE